MFTAGLSAIRSTCLNRDSAERLRLISSAIRISLKTGLQKHLLVIKYATDAGTVNRYLSKCYSTQEKMRYDKQPVF